MHVFLVAYILTVCCIHVYVCAYNACMKASMCEFVRKRMWVCTRAWACTRARACVFICACRGAHIPVAVCKCARLRLRLRLLVVFADPNMLRNTLEVVALSPPRGGFLTQVLQRAPPCRRRRSSRCGRGWWRRPRCRPRSGGQSWRLSPERRPATFAVATGALKMDRKANQLYTGTQW